MSKSLSKRIEEYEASKKRVAKVMSDGHWSPSQESARAIEEADQMIMNAIMTADRFVTRTMCIHAEQFDAGFKKGEGSE